MKYTLLLSLGFLPFYASEVPSTVPASQENSTPQRQAYESNKAQLPAGLKAFIHDFENWPEEEEAKIIIHGLSFMINDLNPERHTAYGGNVGLWIDCRTQTQMQRELFIGCLKHLQKQ